MKILLMNGSPHAKGATKRALDECESSFKNHGCETEYVLIGKGSVHPCNACGKCKGTSSCIYKDIEHIVTALSNADGIIIGTPTHYGNAPGSLYSVLSRLIFSAKRYIEYKPIAVIGTGRRGCISSAICDVQKFFSFCSCPIVSGNYPALLYASDYDSACFDAEGLQNMRSISENMYWIVSAIKAAEKIGITHPISEQKIKTDLPSLL